ncbi:hypothetical protein ATY41_00115 [Leifsonia xyli subsp. xyli]|uniref:Glycosyltransferase n=1 Tax=Leifsonia xyli subsp. xyli TaxID=59736 RepID=A0A1E2SN31_LEIXY|nr:glycosyltransferase [Leifsonia xyli]ODA91149.1 hypothetical protein ATY41_00115 [Leifsonia xyli subsp. xyli]
MKIAYCRVWDTEYPRNARIRAFLEEQLDAEITITRRREGPRWRRMLHDLRALLFTVHGRRVYILSEFSLPYVAVVWAVARLNRGVLVADGFVGQYETMVEDWKKARPGSLRARWYALVDTMACALADLVLIDTRVRAQQLAAAHPGTDVLSLPVGAPGWARPATGTAADRRRAADEPLRVLYYGNYIPLHGPPVIVEALATLGAAVPLEATFIGDGTLRASIRARAAELGIAGQCRFLEPVPAIELADHLAAADVVLGIFGDSPKARSVIANKVWQGLAAGKTVVTRSSPALEEVAGAVGESLVQVDGSSPAELVSALAAALRSIGEPGPDAARRSRGARGVRRLRIRSLRRETDGTRRIAVARHARVAALAGIWQT